MNLVREYSNEPLLNSSTIIQQLCEPLKKYKIDFFVYGKIFSDKKRIVLSTNSEWNAHYIANVYNFNYIQN